ncbi:unnamed protein product [Lupinus luteus]|uniref:Uncharacterized protein n=1 Tax=Lupinus luteus TaxID=3873 RepID=A0AAV1Y8M5_LUPLU
MTSIEPGHVTKPKDAASEVQKGSNRLQPDSTSQDGWFPTLTHVINDSPGSKKNENIIVKVTSWTTSNEHKSLKSLLGEAAQSDKAKSPKFGTHSLNQNKCSFPENSNSGSKTEVNKLLGQGTKPLLKGLVRR